MLQSLRNYFVEVRSELQPQREAGNSMLEMILILPIALFFLFVVIDAGLSLAERSMLRDSLRSGAAAGVSALAQNPAFALRDAGDDLVVKQSNLQSAASEIARQVELRVFANKQAAPGDQATQYAVDVFPVLVGVDGASGVLNPGAVQIFEPSKVRGIGTTLHGASIESVQQQLAAVVVSAGAGTSEHALPLGITSGVNDARAFFPFALFFWVEVSTQTAAINQSYTQSIFGMAHGARESLLVPARVLLS